eukprot:357678-Chlamydomonas_euryale.AAC.11
MDASALPGGRNAGMPPASIICGSSPLPMGCSKVCGLRGMPGSCSSLWSMGAWWGDRCGVRIARTCAGA